MRFLQLFPRALIGVAMIVLPLKGAACTGQRACFTFSPAKFAAAGNFCPSPTDALLRFSGQCGGLISDITSEGTFDGQLCCYDVVQVSDFGDIPFCEGGFGGIGGGFGGFGTSSGGGFGGTAGASAIGTSSGTGGATGCAPCTDLLSNGIIEPICGSSVTFWSQLVSCACATCPSECDTSTCGQLPLTQVCASCLMASCAVELSTCENDF